MGQNWKPKITPHIYSQLIYDKGTKNTQGKKIISSINGSEGRIFTYKRMKSNTYLTSFVKISLKCVKDLNRRHETINLLEENLGEKKLFDINLSCDLFLCVCVCRSTRNRGKSKPMVSHQTKKLLHSKGYSQQSEKATYRMKLNIYKTYIR